MASRTATESTTIQDVIQIFQAYDVHDSLHTVLDNEDSFNSICEILRAIFRCTPRKHRILEIVAEELKPLLTPEQTTTSEASPLLGQSVTQESPSAGIKLSDHTCDEDLVLLNSPRIEISTTKKDDQAITKDQTAVSEIPYADQTSTKEISKLFQSWIQNPQEFWEIKNAIGLKEEVEISTRLKFFIQNAKTKSFVVDIRKLQYRFTSILVYQSFQKIMNTKQITSSLTRQYLGYINISLKDISECTLLLHGGKNRIEFDRRIAPHKDEIDHGPQCLPELNDNLWDCINSSRVRAKARNAIAKLQSQNITSWSERSSAQLAAERILHYGQKFLGLVDLQTQTNGTKRRLNFIDQTSSSNVYSKDKRLRTGSRDGSLLNHQNLITPRPNTLDIHANATTP